MAKIHFLNVDEGDCSIIQHDNGNVTMLDICCGNIEEEVQKSFSAESLNTGLRGNFKQKEHPTNPVNYLKRHGIKSIFRYIQTHPDMDHMDGLENLFQNFSIINFWDTENKKKQEFGENGKSGRYLKIDWDRYCKMRTCTSDPKALFYYDGSSNKYFAENDKGKLTDDYLQILSPTRALLNAANEAGDWNDSSYVILYWVGGKKILFCGDADMNTIQHLIDNHYDEISDLDVLIAPHHGRDSNKDFSFLDVMNPKLTLIGNALSKHLAYDQWNNRSLPHLTNNQVGDVLLEIQGGTLFLSISNKTAADKICQELRQKDAEVDATTMSYWFICEI